MNDHSSRLLENSNGDNIGGQLSSCAVLHSRIFMSSWDHYNHSISCRFHTPHPADALQVGVAPTPYAFGRRLCETTRDPRDIRGKSCSRSIIQSVAGPRFVVPYIQVLIPIDVGFASRDLFIPIFLFCKEAEKDWRMRGYRCRPNKQIDEVAAENAWRTSLEKGAKWRRSVQNAEANPQRSFPIFVVRLEPWT